MIIVKFVYLSKLSVMDLSTRKLNLIAYLAQLQDENFFGKIEQYILNKQKLEKDFKPFTIEDLVSRVQESEKI